MLDRAALTTNMGWLWAICALGAALIIARMPLAGAGVLIAGIAIGVAVTITPMAALVAMLTLAPLRTLIATEAPTLIPFDIGQLSLVALLGAWITALIVQRRAIRFGWTPVFIPLIAFIAAAGLTAFSAWSLSAWLSEWLKWIQVALLILVCLSMARDWRWLPFALAIAGVANGVIGIYQYFGGSGALHLVVNGDKFRAFGTFGQPNPFGGFMGLLAPVALMTGVGYALQWYRARTGHESRVSDLIFAVFYLAAGAVMALALYLSWSRGAWLAFASCIVAIGFALPRRWIVGALLVGLAAAVLGGLWASGRLPASIVSRIESATQDILSISDVRGVDIDPNNYANIERFAHWQAAVNMATAYPFLGVGFGNYEIAYANFRLINWKFALGHAHNYYLNVLGEAGMIGLVAYLALWGGIFALTWRARRHPDPLARCIIVGLLGSWVYLAIHSLTDNLYVNNAFLHLGVLLGLLAVLDQQTRQETQWHTRNT
jgi:O-antigen ligase